MQEMLVQSLGWEDPLEKEMATQDNSMNRGAWWATVHGGAQSQTQLKRLSARTHTHMLYYS